MTAKYLTVKQQNTKFWTLLNNLIMKAHHDLMDKVVCCTKRFETNKVNFWSHFSIAQLITVVYWRVQWKTWKTHLNDCCQRQMRETNYKLGDQNRSSIPVNRNLSHVMSERPKNPVTFLPEPHHEPILKIANLTLHVCKHHVCWINRKERKNHRLIPA